MRQEHSGAAAAARTQTGTCARGGTAAGRGYPAGVQCGGVQRRDGLHRADAVRSRTS